MEMAKRRPQVQAAVGISFAGLVAFVVCVLLSTSRNSTSSPSFTSRPSALLSFSVPVFYSLENQPTPAAEAAEIIGTDGWRGHLFARRAVNDEVQEKMDRSVDMIRKWMQASGELTGDYESDTGHFRKMAAQMAVKDMDEQRVNETRDWEETEDPSDLRWVSAARQWAWSAAAEAHRNNTDEFHEWEEENPRVYPEALIFPPEEYPTGWIKVSDAEPSDQVAIVE